MNPDDLYARYRELQRYLDWTETDRRRVVSMREVVLPHLDAIVDDFYQEMFRHPAASRVLTGGASQIRRLRQSLHNWLEQLFSGTYDDHYVAARWRVGLRHAEIGLEIIYTHAALSRLRSQIQRAIHTAAAGSDAHWEAGESVDKLLDLDLAIIEDSYEHQRLQNETFAERERGERKFRNLVEAAACVIIILRDDLTMQYLSPYAERVTGYRADEVRERSFLHLFVDEIPENHVQVEWQTLLANLPASDHELPIRMRDESIRWFAWNAIRLDDFAGQVAVLAVGYDVTEKRRSADRLLQAERLAAIGQTITGLAHESRNALQRINSCMEMLEFEVEDRPEALELIRRSQKAQDDLARLFDEVRSFAAPIHLECSETVVSHLWREAWQLVQPQCRERDVTLVVEPESDELTIRADRFRLVQVFRNLFENSLSACADPVRISILWRRLPTTSFGMSPSHTADVQSRSLHGHHLPEVGRPTYVEIRVRDNGPGLDRTARHEVFEPFFTTKAKGTGLGMAIAHRVVTAHGGSIVVGDPNRAGAEFILVLPLEPQ
jgi:PAS domain S-box-containing protein